MVLPGGVIELISRLEAGGFSGYAVGGCVRDSLMGRAPSDWDIATSALPDEMKAQFSGLRTIDTGIRHGTITVIVDGQSCEVTTFRTDGEYADHRRPNRVRFVGDLREDLARRDFTINAMAVDRFGSLTDPFGGQADLAARVVRCVGDPDARFDEDVLRILRALRFASQLGFAIEDGTTRALRAKRALLRHVSAERIDQELTKMLIGDGVEPVLLTFPDVLSEVIPEIAPAIGFRQHNPHHDRDVWAHTARAVGLVPPDAALRLAALLHDLGKPRCFSLDDGGVGHFYGHAKLSVRIAERTLAKLRVDNRTRDRVLALVRAHDMRPEPTDKWLTRRLNELGERGLRDLFLVQRADVGAQSQHLLAEKLALLDACEAKLDALIGRCACYSLSTLAVNGTELIALGVPSGRRVGEALDQLLGQVMDGALPNERTALLDFARARFVDVC